MNRYRIAFGLALAMALATFCLIALGGLVYNTGSSLACPDWPLCHEGEWMPKMVGGVLYEHSHRLLAALVGVCSLLLCGLLWKSEPGAAGLKRAGAALPLLVLFQAVLGAVVVLWKLPMLVRAGHLATSMIVLLTLVYLCRALWQRNAECGMRNAELEMRNDPGAAALLVAAAALVYAQLILGALVRHTDSSTAAGWGLAGSMIPIDPLTGKYSLWPASGPSQLNVFHRYFALVVAMVVIVCCARFWGLLRSRGAGALAWLPAGLVLAQIAVGVGMLSAWDLAKDHPGITGPQAIQIQVAMRTLHLAVGTALLATLWLLALIGMRKTEQIVSA